MEAKQAVPGMRGTACWLKVLGYLGYFPPKRSMIPAFTFQLF